MAHTQLGPYLIERTLGRGGMGKVYAAVDEKTGDRVAVKVLTATLADDEHFRLRFEGEIEALKMLTHPNIVQLLGYGEQDGELFYAMELVEGQSLQEELQSGRRFPWRETAHMAIEICGALRHAHDRGVVHRDLKPANLMLCTDGTVKLTDFGIAKLFGASKMTADGGVMGSADYMSPEQATGESATARSDLYSLGSVLYALLCGEPPFRDKTLAEIIYALRFKGPTPIGKLADVPSKMESIIARLMHKKPENRIATAQAAANRFKEFLLDHPLVEEESKEDTLIQDQFSDNEGDASIWLGTTLHADADRGQSASDPVPAGGETTVPPEHEKEQPKEDPPATTRYTTVSDHLDSPHQTNSDDTKPTGLAWLKTVALFVAFVLVASIVVYAMLPASADKIYKRITDAANSGQTELLVDREDDIQNFLMQFPNDSRCEQVATFRDTVGLHRQHERFQLRIQQRGRKGSLAPIERAYLEASHLLATDPETAAVKLQAIIDVFGSSKDDSSSARDAVELAGQQLQNLKTQVAGQSKSQRTDIQRRLQDAEELFTRNPKAAETIYRGIIVLYADKPWATDLVQRAQNALAASASSPADESKRKSESN